MGPAARPVFRPGDISGWEMQERFLFEIFALPAGMGAVSFRASPYICKRAVAGFPP